MTIAAGLVNKDGAVLCADAQLTVPGTLKFPESKILPFDDINWQPIFVYAGDPSFSKMVISRLAECISKSQGEVIELGVLREVCRKIHEEYYQLYSPELRNLEVNLLFATRTSPVRLYEVTGPTLTQVETYECLGKGANLARAVLSDLLLPDLTCEELARAAAFMLMKARAHVYGCGAKSQIVMIPAPPEDDLLVLPYYQIFESDTEELEAVFTNFQKAVSPVLLALPEAHKNTSRFAEKLRNLQKTVQACRSLMARRERKSKKEVEQLLEWLMRKKNETTNKQEQLPCL